MPRTFQTRPFSKVVRDMWGDDRFQKLTPVKPSGQDLWIYLLIGPHGNVIPGLFVGMGFGTLADRLKWETSAVKKHWKEIADQRMAKADWDAGVIWLPNGFRHNEPANPNVVTSWRNVPLPNCPLVVEALRSLRGKLWALETDRIRRHIREKKDPRKSIGWVQAFDQVFGSKFDAVIHPALPVDFPRELIEWLPADFGKGSPEGLGEGFLEGLGDDRGSKDEDSLEGLGGMVPPKGWGSTRAGARAGSELTNTNTPPTPPPPGGAGSESKRRAVAEHITRAERKKAVEVLTECGCPHEGIWDGEQVSRRCETDEECIGRIVGEHRADESRGLKRGLAEARA